MEKATFLGSLKKAMTSLLFEFLASSEALQQDVDRGYNQMDIAEAALSQRNQLDKRSYDLKRQIRSFLCMN